MTLIRFIYGAATSVGRVRKVNEDSLLAVPPLFVVADGMGGHGSGDLASRIAVDEMRACAALRPLFAEAVLTALEHANRRIIDGHGATRMGTTITGVAGLETGGGDHLMVFNVGDSRVYRLAAGRLEQLTVDHSEVQELVLAGVITREQARTHPRRNIVTRALGGDATLHADHWLLPATGGHRYLACSDGLFTEVPEGAIEALLSAGQHPQPTAEALVAAACEAGGRDNVTAVVVDIDADDDGADETTLPRDQLPLDSDGRASDGGREHGAVNDGAANGQPPNDRAPNDRAPHDRMPRDRAPRDQVPNGWGRADRRGRAEERPPNVGLRGLGLIGPDDTDHD